MPVLKNARYEAFTQAVFKGMAGREAYTIHISSTCTKAGGDAAASKLLNSDKIQARLTELKERVAERTVVNRVWLEEKVQVLAGKAEEKDQLGVARACYEMLGRDKGVFQERKTVTVRSLAQLTEEELLDELARLDPGNQSAAQGGPARGAGKASNGKGPAGKARRITH